LVSYAYVKRNKHKKSSPIILKSGLKTTGHAYWSQHWDLYLLIIPAIVLTFIFAYIPMYGAQIAFRDFNIKDGIWGSEWVGIKYFIRFVTSKNLPLLLKNTVGISLYSLIAGFPLPIIFALMLNELRFLKLKKSIQMITYAPHFISTVAICGIIVLFTDKEAGLINIIINAIGGDKIEFLAQPIYFKTIYVVSGIWQGLGWGSIIYLAALSGVDPQMVEASIIDGASRLQKILYINIPSISPTIIIILLLSCGSLLGVGFEKILLLQNPLNMEASDVISTYVYRLGILNAQFSYTTAIGLFNSIVSLILLTIVNYVSRYLGGTTLW